jgi:outer membrane protein OmpA-like peptidoglycan-associated protein
MTRKTRSAFKRNTAVLLACALATGCAIDPRTGQPSLTETFASDDPCSNNSRNIGIVAGTLVGAVIGSQVDKRTGALIGAGTGAMLGGFIGRDMDRKRCELSKLAKKYALDMTVTELKAESVAGAPSGAKPEAVGLSVSIRDQDNSSQFQVGSDRLTPAAQVYFEEIADQYSFSRQSARLPANADAQARQALEVLKTKRLLIIGHTDDSGSSQLNADLSERRARALAKLFEQAGVPTANLYFQGAGETLPVADNRTGEGRGKNRRVEIVDLTDDRMFQQYLANRSARTEFYRVDDAPRARPARDVATAEAAPARKPEGRSAGRRTAPASIEALPAPQVAAAGPARQPQAASAPMPAQLSRAQPAQPAASPQPAQSAQSTPSARAVQPARAAQAAPSAPFDFGGEPTGSQVALLDIGPVASPSGFNILPLAQAGDSPVTRSCEFDKPRIANGVKSLRDNKEIATAEYMPGLYGTSWTDDVNGNLVALTKVAVLRDGGAPAGKPQLLVYKNYKPGSNARPDYTGTPEVNTYKGQKALLYRVFVGGPINCLDIVIPNGNPESSKASWLYYDANGKPLRAGFNPQKIKS